MPYSRVNEGGYGQYSRGRTVWLDEVDHSQLWERPCNSGGTSGSLCRVRKMERPRVQSTPPPPCCFGRVRKIMEATKSLYLAQCLAQNEHS